MADQLEPIHQAALDGDLASINQLLQEDGGLLNAQVQEDIDIDCWAVMGFTPLMLATYGGHDVVVARLLALGANVMAEDYLGFHATQHACLRNRPSTLALLLDAGVPLNERVSGEDVILLIMAVHHGFMDCIAVLLACGGHLVELEARSYVGRTALYEAASRGHAEVMELLLLAGADPTIRNDAGETPLEKVRSHHHHVCIALLKAALAGAHHTRALLKARALLDAAFAVRKVHDDAQAKGLPRAAHQRGVLAAAPAYLRERVREGEELPRVTVNTHADEELVACVKYALGIEGGGGAYTRGTGRRSRACPAKCLWSYASSWCRSGRGRTCEVRESGQQFGRGEQGSKG